MEEKTAQVDSAPWSFVIEFGEGKAGRGGYRVDDLYDCVDACIACLGIRRVSRNVWSAAHLHDKVTAQCTALCGLARKEWVMNAVETWTVYENDAQCGHDYLDVVRAVSPELMRE